MTLKETLREQLHTDFDSSRAETLNFTLSKEIHAFLDQAYDRIREESLREAQDAVEDSREIHGSREEIAAYILGCIQSLITKK